MVLDVVKTKNENIYVPEFITPPMLLQNEEPALKEVAEMIECLYGHLNVNIKSGPLRIQTWVNEFNKDNKNNGSMVYTSDDKGEFIAPNDKTQMAFYSMLVPEHLQILDTLKKPGPESKLNDRNKVVNKYCAQSQATPYFHLHINTSIYIEQMFTPEMRAHFKTFESPPEITEKGKNSGLKTGHLRKKMNCSIMESNFLRKKFINTYKN